MFTTARALALSTSLAALCAAPALGFDLSNMSDAERSAFRAEIRAYLMDNPQVILEAVQSLEERQAAEQAAAEVNLIADNAEAIFNDGFSWIGGNPDGDITIVEFMDYRCGYCRKAHADVAKLLDFDGNIRLIVKEFPILGEDSLASSKFAIAIKQLHGDEAYGAVHEELITMRGSANEPALAKVAKNAGLDHKEILAKMESEEVLAEIRATRALAETLQIRGTPTFVLEDELLRGYVPFDGMLAMVEQIRAE